MNVSPIRRTLLSLHRYARIVGLNPVHFSGAVGATVWPSFGNCSSYWTRYPWQSVENNISWAELAEEIYSAEREISNQLGYNPAPTWTVEEMRNYPIPAQVGAQSYGRNARGRLQSIRAKMGRVISCGKRTATMVDLGATVTYSDPDADGFDELATISAATSLTSVEGIRLYFDGTLAQPDWEIRPIKSMAISGGTLTITADSWIFIDPNQHGVTPTISDYMPLDADSAAVYVSTVDIYREHVDTTDYSCQFGWNGEVPSTIACASCGGTGCPLCTNTTQDGCTTILNPNEGYVTPYPATYTDGEWSTVSYAVGRDPDWVKLWYCSGEISDDYFNGYSFDPLPEYFAQAIAMLASARLTKPICGCNNVEGTVANWQRDLSQSTRDAFYVRFDKMDIFSNPFGTRMGEVMAWRRISNAVEHVTEAGVM